MSDTKELLLSELNREPETALEVAHFLLTMSSQAVAPVSTGFNLEGRPTYISVPHSATFEMRGVAICLQASKKVPHLPVRAPILACALKILSLVTPVASPLVESVEKVHRVFFTLTPTRIQVFVEAAAALQGLVARGGDQLIDPVIAGYVIAFMNLVLMIVECEIAASRSGAAKAAVTVLTVSYKI